MTATNFQAWWQAITPAIFYVGVAIAAFAAGWAGASVILRQKRELAVAECEGAMNKQVVELSQCLAAAQEKNSRIPDLELQVSNVTQEMRAYRDQHARATNRIASLETQLEQERKNLTEKLSVLEEAQNRFSDAFKALSSEALRQNNTSFLELAKTTLEKTQETVKGEFEKRHDAIDSLVKPMRESLDKVDAKINELEKARSGAYEALTSQVKSLAETQDYLRSETSNLVRALRSPTVRGRWGELQLRRVVELAGMVEHCDFVEQSTMDTDEGRVRPDLLVYPPGGKAIVVDAKTPLQAYLDSLEATDDETRARLLDQHAAQFRTHIEKLSRKAYREQFKSTPDFVVLFVPGEPIFSAAMERDSSLMEYASEKQVILATPTTLIALLRAVCYGWRQEKLAQNAREISQLGSELYKRFADLSIHIGKLGRSLSHSVEAYNKAVGSIETRVLVSARKFKELGAAPLGMEIEVLPQVEQIARELQAPELLPGAESNGHAPSNGA